MLRHGVAVCLLLVVAIGTVMAMDADMHYPSRSGDFFISTDAGLDSVFVVDRLPERLGTALARSPVGDTLATLGLADFMARVLGVESPSAAPRSPAATAVASELFNKARANVLIMAEGLRADELRRAPGAAEFAFAAGGLDSVALLTTALTGQPPRAHGVVGGQWREAGTSGFRAAFDSQTSSSLSATLPDILSQQTRGRALSLAVSADAQLAAAAGVKPQLQELVQNGEWAAGAGDAEYSFAWDEALGSFVALGSGADLEAGMAGAVAQATRSGDALLAAHFITDSATNTARLDGGDGAADAITFDLSNAVELRAAAEVAFALELAAVLRDAAVAAGEEEEDAATAAAAVAGEATQHFLTFAFDGPRSFRERFGADSAKHVALLSLLERHVIPRLSELLFAGAYGQQAAVEVMCVAAPVSRDGNLVNRAYNLLRPHLAVADRPSFERALPNVFLSDQSSSGKAGELCDALRQSVNASGGGSGSDGASVACPGVRRRREAESRGEDFEASKLRSARAESERRAVGAGEVDENYEVIFNIVLGLMLAFFTAVIFAAYSIGYMDPGADGVIYTRAKQD